MTSAPRPRKKRYLGGAKVTRIMVCVPQSGRIGLGASISYGQEICVGCTC